MTLSHLWWFLSKNTLLSVYPPPPHRAEADLKFPENCMKMKNIAPRGAGVFPKFYYLDPPLQGADHLTQLHEPGPQLWLG